MNMKIFDREFDVALLHFEDKSAKGSTDVNVTFTTGGVVYHYRYCGGPTMALSSVVKDNTQTGKTEEVYSSWEHIPNGSYFEEIGRRLSVE
jgi:hypothetical protein